jgi:pimeloyl-ACP methyl ester carboxylesterase
MLPAETAPSTIARLAPETAPSTSCTRNGPLHLLHPNSLLLCTLGTLRSNVWFGNSRGNTYSQRNTYLNPDSDAFWAWSYDEMALMDLPAMVEYVLNSTGVPALSLVGHSQGTTQSFAAFSLDEHDAARAERSLRLRAAGRGTPLHAAFRVRDSAWWQARIQSFSALAPVAFVDHQTSLLLTLLADLDVAYILQLFGFHEFLVDPTILEILDPLICTILPNGCDLLLELIVGPSKNLNDSRIDVYVSETPAGTSVQNIVHWSQGVTSNAFQMYDFGSQGNLQHYGQPTPPPYPLANITVPLALFAGQEDDLGDPQDVQILLDILPTSTVRLFKNYAGVAHLDFTWGVDANTIIYEDVIAFILSNL